MKKLIKILFSILLVIIITLFSVPYIFKNRIENVIKSEINNAVNAKVDYKDVSLSLLTDFPNLHVNVKNITIEGIDEFAKTKLAVIDNFGLSLNFKKLLFNKDLEIKRINIVGADVHIKVLKNAKTNYDIVKESTDNDEQPEKSYTIKIEKYRISNSNITYDDEATNLYFKIKKLNHTGTGIFSDKSYLLTNQTTAKSINVKYDGIHYINKANTNAKMQVLIENDFTTYTIKDMLLTINDLELTSDMFFNLKGDDINMDINFETKQNKLKNLLSLIPKEYMPDLKGTKTKGLAQIKGFVKGTYNEKSYPAYGINFNLKNGFIKYADLPQSIKNINAISKINFPGGKNLDQTIIDVQKIHFDIAGSNTTGMLKIKNPTTDPFINTQFKSNLDLSTLKQSIYIPEISILKGILDTDFHLKGRVSDIEKQAFDKFDAKGYFNLKNLIIKGDSLAYPITVSDAKLQVNPQALKVQEFNSQFGKSDFNLTGDIQNYISYLLKKEKVLKANFALHSDNIDLNELMKISSEKEVDTTSMQSIKIPKNISIDFIADADNVDYKKMNLQKVKGKIKIADQKASLSGILTEALDGQLNITGIYDTSSNINKSEMSINMEKISIKKAANTFTSFETFAPILKKVQGAFFSNMTMQVNLDNQMNPILKTMDASGNFDTDNIKINNVNSLKKISQLLNIQELGEPTIEQIKTHFSIENGEMKVKPFGFKLNDMNAKLSGTVNLEQKIDFDLYLNVPKQKLGNKATSIIENLVGKLDKLGLDTELPDIIKIKFNISGDYNHPKILPLIDGYEGKSTKEIITKVLTDKAEKIVDDTKEKALKSAQKKADSLLTQAKLQANKLNTMAQKQADKLIAESKKVGEKIKIEAQKQGENIIQKAGNDPFKKIAAQSLAKKINKEANKKANDLETKAQNKAKILLKNAKEKSNTLIQKAQKEKDSLL